MKTEYWSDDVTVAKSQQTYAYTYTSMATFWTYDYVCSLHQEWTFLLQSRWTKVKGLYIVTRFVPFLLLMSHLYLIFIPNENSEECKTLIDISSCFSIISITCSECFFVLRTYALWKNNKFVLTAMLTAFLAFIIACVSAAFVATATTPFATSAIPGVTGCPGSLDIFIPFLLLFAFQLGLMLLTLIRAIQSWRMASGHLYAVLVKHNIFYYACGLFLSGVNVLALLLLHYQYQAMFQDFQFIILAILALRMHLHLWQIDQHVQGSDVLESNIVFIIPQTDISSASRTA